jgi:hypothetical protein
MFQIKMKEKGSKNAKKKKDSKCILSMYSSLFFMLWAPKFGKDVLITARSLQEIDGIYQLRTCGLLCRCRHN